MANRNCAQAASLDAGYSLFFLQEGAPYPKARSLALGAIGSEEAQPILLRAPQELEARTFSHVRAAVVEALGRFQAPQQAELAERSASALSALLEKGDVSYLVETAATLRISLTCRRGRMSSARARRVSRAGRACRRGSRQCC